MQTPRLPEGWGVVDFWWSMRLAQHDARTAQMPGHVGQSSARPIHMRNEVRFTDLQ